MRRQEWNRNEDDSGSIRTGDKRVNNDRRNREKVYDGGCRLGNGYL